MTGGKDTGNWCSRCFHMIVPHRGSWKHHSRDDWSRSAHGGVDCGCVHAGWDCSPRLPSPKELRELPRRGRRPDAVILDEVHRFQLAGMTSRAFTSGSWLTFAPGALYTWAPDASTED